MDKYDTKKLRTMFVKYMGVTCHKPSRVKIYDCFEHERQQNNLGNCKKTAKYQVTLCFSSQDHDNTCDIAINYLNEKGFNIVGYSEAKDGYYIHVDNWNNGKDSQYITL